MRRGFGPLALALFLFLFALLSLPGDGNQGSFTGSCSCDHIISSGTQIPPDKLNRMRKYLKAFHRCQFFIRFQLQSKSVCGGREDQWVQELVNCFEHKECGISHWQSFHRQKHVPQVSTRIPEATEGKPPDTSTVAQFQSAQQSILPSGAPSLNKELTHHLETTILPSGYGLEARPEAEANEKQQDDKQRKEPGAGAGTPALVPVLSLLAIAFFLVAALVYVLCNRRVTRQSSAGLQLCYTPVTRMEARER
uniref:C-X-C motif chemokine 16 n=1 Tax=Niviventer confucianus TaxID=248811 RepID=A0A6M6RFU0_NINCN|nr:CXCL16 [Niviventer confucianus]